MSIVSKTMKIYAIHYQNDFTSTAKVFGQLISGWEASGKEVVVVTGGRDQSGWLSNIKGVTYINVGKNFEGRKIQQLFRFFIRQFICFIKLCINVKSEDIVYINTLSPFGAALAGRMKGAKVIYHLHESNNKPLTLREFLYKVMSRTVDEVIYSSNYLAIHEKVENKSIHVLYNALDHKLVQKAKFSRTEKRISKNVLMVSSLDTNKGISEYLDLASRHEFEFNFTLVLINEESVVTSFFDSMVLPSNLQVVVAGQDISKYYEWADIVLGLATPNCWIESFGIYIVEGMAFGLPVIIPQSEYITDLVEENESGFLVDSKDLDGISKKLTLLFENENEYNRMSEAAVNHVSFYNDDKLFIGRSIEILTMK